MPEAAGAPIADNLFHLNYILLLLGLALMGGTLGGRLFQRFRIPQVVGYITIGVMLGQTWLGILSSDILKELEPFNHFALGLIGFMIGGELKKAVFVKQGKQLLYILLGEGLGAFIAVFLLVGCLGGLFLDDPAIVWPLALLLGAISSATAPAATTEVLREYKTRGPVTRSTLAIVALDDGLALLLFAVASSLAAGMVSHKNPGLLQSLGHPLFEIMVSTLIGFLVGVLLSIIVKRYSEEERLLAFSIGAVLLVLGLALVLNMDSLLACMALGATVVNLVPRRSQETFKLVQRFTPPIYVLFFVLVGAELHLDNMTLPITLLMVIYIVGRSAGKMTGTYVAARVAKAPETVRKYLPLCLFSQAGVAIGLSILSSQRFPGEISDTIVVVIVASVFVVELIGPSFVKLAVTKAGEVGLNITAEDIVRQSRARDLMDKDVPLIYEDTALPGILKIFSSTTNWYYPVVTAEKELLGIITVNDIRDALMDSEISSFLLAYDLMEPVPVTASPDLPMVDTQELIAQHDLEYIPVVGPNNRLEGFMEVRATERLISRKIIELQEKQEALG